MSEQKSFQQTLSENLDNYRNQTASFNFLENLSSYLSKDSLLVEKIAIKQSELFEAYSNIEYEQLQNFFTTLSEDECEKLVNAVEEVKKTLM